MGPSSFRRGRPATGKSGIRGIRSTLSQRRHAVPTPSCCRQAGMLAKRRRAEGGWERRHAETAGTPPRWQRRHAVATPPRRGNAAAPPRRQRCSNAEQHGSTEHSEANQWIPQTCAGDVGFHMDFQDFPGITWKSFLIHKYVQILADT